MSKLNIIKVLAIGGLLILSACEKQDNSQHWRIGKDKPMKKTLVELDSPKNIKICTDKFKHISFPLVLHVNYDDKKYYNMLEGVCITVHAKVVEVRFANPSSGKSARGTFEILDS